MRQRRMEENARTLFKPPATQFNLLLDVARPSSEKPYNCYSRWCLQGSEGEINQFMGSCHPPVKFSSHGYANSIAFPGCICMLA